MVTWPANTAPNNAMEFVSRQVALRERLRWALHGSQRRRKLEAELAQVVLEELQREAVREDRGQPDVEEPELAWFQR